MERRLSGEVEAERSSGPHGTVDPDLALLYDVRCGMGLDVVSLPMNKEMGPLEC